MRSLDGPGSYAGSGVDVEIKEIYFACINLEDGCTYEGYIEVYNDWLLCPKCGIETFQP